MIIWVKNARSNVEIFAGHHNRIVEEDTVKVAALEYHIHPDYAYFEAGKFPTTDNMIADNVCLIK